MTRLNRVVTAVNWKYAVGEVLLIVVGILIALAAAMAVERARTAEANARRAEVLSLLELAESLGLSAV